MLRLAGIPISDLEKITASQRESQDYINSLTIFNNTKPVDTSPQIIDPDADISTEEMTFLKNVLVLLVDTNREDLPIVESKDRNIYIKLLLGNTESLIDQYQALSNKAEIQLGHKRLETSSYKKYNSVKRKLYKRKEPLWLRNLTIPFFQIVNTNTSYTYTGDAIADYANAKSVESQFPILASPEKAYTNSLEVYYDEVFIGFSPISGLSYSIPEFSVTRYPYNFNIFNMVTLNRKLTSKLVAPDDEYYRIMPENSTFKNYLVEIYADFSEDYSELEDSDLETFTVSEENIYDVLSEIDILEGWKYV